MNRRKFLKNLLALPAGLVIFQFLEACGSSSSATSSTLSCSSGANVNYTNPGHSHSVLNLTAAHMAARTVGNYTLLTGSHSHTFTLTASDFALIAAGTSVAKTDLEGDGHIINISCTA